jgi:ribosomal protein S18 acetylase RimI-like enzyme
MKLAPFLPLHSDLVASWATTSSELSFWAALDQVPTPETFAGWHADPDVCPYLLVAERPIAYGEIWVAAEDDEVELARVLVDPAARNGGLGQALVRLLVARSRTLGVSTAWVRVVPENLAAIRCYTAAGFSPADPELEAMLNAPQPRSYRWLQQAL